MKARNFNSLIRSIAKSQDIIGLHPPLFIGNEKRFINETIDSNYVSSVGKFVDKFEKSISSLTTSKYRYSYS